MAQARVCHVAEMAKPSRGRVWEGCPLPLRGEGGGVGGIVGGGVRGSPPRNF